MIKYKKDRPHVSGPSPRDRQMKTQGGSDTQVINELKTQLQDLTSALRDREAGPANTGSAVAGSGTVYTEDEFQDALLDQLKIELEKKHPGIYDLEANLQKMHEEATSHAHTLLGFQQRNDKLASEVGRLTGLLEAKDETIAILKDKPINVQVTSDGSNAKAQAQEDMENFGERPGISPVYIDPTKKEDSEDMIPHISVDSKVGEDSKVSVNQKLNKLKGLMGGPPNK